MRILFATSECAPFSKSGGLADVAFSLPPALKKSGDDIAIITPLYKCVKAKYADTMKLEYVCNVDVNGTPMYCGLFRGELNGVTVWFIDNEDLFNRDKLYGYDDDPFRFAFFSKAIVELLPKFDFMPDILHCNDWETAPAIIYLRNDQSWNEALKHIRTVYTIHNIAYQGQFGEMELGRTFGLPYGWYDGGLGYEYEGRRDINLMKGAMLMSDAVSTVSPTYAKELHQPQFGMGLEHVADIVENKLFGILNGIDMDHYDPSKDKRIPANFTAKNRAGKKKCKAYIQETFGLEVNEHYPVFCSVARLNEQKGIELIKQILPGVMDMGAQLIVFGQGEQQYIDYFNWAASQWPGQLGFSSDYTEDMAAKIFAGADFYLMPSRFEPCGLSQMMAMRYGTIPVVHETGGLKDSVRAYSSFDGYGDGFSFSNYNAKELYLAILQAVRVYFGDKETFKLLKDRCMAKDFSWDKSADLYNRMYSEIVEGGDGEYISFEDAFSNLKELYTLVDDHNRRHYAEQYNEGFHRAIQFQITGRGAGVFYVEFDNGEMHVEPFAYDNADVRVATSYDNLVGMIKGEINPDKLLMNGQLNVHGNMARLAEVRMLLGRNAESAAEINFNIDENKSGARTDEGKAPAKKTAAKKAPAKKAPAKKAPAKKTAPKAE